jgi:hypothetical protein
MRKDFHRALVGRGCGSTSLARRANPDDQGTGGDRFGINLAPRRRQTKARRSTAGAATGFEPAMAAEKLRHAGLGRRQGIEMV